MCRPDEVGTGMNWEREEAGDGGEGRGRGAHNRDKKPQAGGDLSGQDGFLSKGREVT